MTIFDTKSSWSLIRDLNRKQCVRHAGPCDGGIDSLHCHILLRYWIKNVTYLKKSTVPSSFCKTRTAASNFMIIWQSVGLRSIFRSRNFHFHKDDDSIYPKLEIVNALCIVLLSLRFLPKEMFYYASILLYRRIRNTTVFYIDYLKKNLSMAPRFAQNSN
jgi:hypothetical protein